MTLYRSFTTGDAVRAAEAALSRLTGEAFVVDQVRDLGDDQRRNLILRAAAIDSSGVTTSTIIKATRAADYDPAAENVYQTSGLVKEWAAATLLTQQAAKSGHPGVLLASDVAQGVLVFRDHGEQLEPR